MLYNHNLTRNPKIFPFGFGKMRAFNSSFKTAFSAFALLSFDLYSIFDPTYKVSPLGRYFVLLQEANRKRKTAGRRKLAVHRPPCKVKPVFKSIFIFLVQISLIDGRKTISEFQRASFQLLLFLLLPSALFRPHRFACFVRLLI